MDSNVKPPPQPAPAGKISKPQPPMAQAAAAPAGEKDPVAVTAPQLQPAGIHDQMYYDVSADGAVWAMGAGYKARFGADGATYIPFLGGHAPKNYPISLHVVNISVGSQQVNFAIDAAPLRTDDRVAYNRGAVTELYDLKPASVEQSFVFQSMPHSGELKIQLQLLSELTRSEDASGFKFSNDLGSVSYGKATVFDAAGRSAAADALSVDGGLEIRVPASFLAGAKFPVTIDPVISTTTVYNGDLLSRAPDVAFDVTNNVYLAVWEHNFSDTDGDVFGQLLDTSANPIGGTFQYIDFTTDNWRAPSVASNNIADQFLAVAQVGDSPNRIIKGRTRDAASTAEGPQFQISDPGDAGDKFNAHVGGDPILIPPTYYCVVWQRNFAVGDDDIHARLVKADSTLLGTSTILVDNSSGTLDRFPNISKSDGADPFATQEWNIVWQRQFNPTDEDIRGAQIHWDGGITNASFSIDFSSDNDEVPTATSLVDGNGGTRNYMVAYQEGTNPRTIFARVLNGTSIVASANLTSLEGSDATQDHVRASADTGGAKYTVAYAQSYLGSATDYDIWISTFCLDGGVIRASELHRNLAFSVTHEDQVQISARHSGSANPSTQFAAVWHDVDGSPYGFIEGGIYQAPNECCVADITGNGVVNVDDLLAVINNWGFCFNCDADINGSIFVDVDDLLIVINGWGPCP